MKKKHNWMLIEDFCDKYGVTTDAVFVKRYNRDIPNEAFQKVSRNRLLIDEEWFIRRWQFKEKMFLANQDLYFFFTEHFSDAQFAHMLKRKYGTPVASMKDHFYKTLFKPVNDTGIATGIGKFTFIIYKYYRAIDRELKKNGLSIELVLDRRAGI